MDTHPEVKDTVTILKATGILQAVVIKEYLERSGVPVFLSYETTGYSDQVQVKTSDEINIDVPAEFETNVRMLLESEPKSGEIFSVPHHS